MALSDNNGSDSSSNSDDMEMDVDSFCEKLLTKQVTSLFDRPTRDFWPASIIRDLTTKDTVRQVLYSNSEDYNEELVNFISIHAKRLFCLTATTLGSAQKLLTAMKLFYEKDYKDSDLSAETLDDIKAADNHTAIDEQLKSLDKKLWRKKAVYDFQETQWKALVPILSTAQSNYNFKPKTILPFISIENNVGSGAFSRVHKVEIHPDHYQDTQCPVSTCWCVFSYAAFDK